MDYDNEKQKKDLDDDIVSPGADYTEESEPDAELNELDTLAMDFVDKRLDDIDYVTRLVEAILLMSPEPIETRRVANSLGIKKAVMEKSVASLLDKYRERGIIIQEIGEGLEFGTNPDVAEHIEKFFQIEKRRRISRAGLQTLSIIAYNQPVTRAEIESFRGGINSGGVLQSLLERDLIKIAGRKETPGNPYLYSVSDEFLRYFGLKSVDELKEKLPAIEDEIAKDGGITQLQLKDMGILSDSSRKGSTAETISDEDLSSDSEIPHDESDSMENAQKGEETL